MADQTRPTQGQEEKARLEELQREAAAQEAARQSPLDASLAGPVGPPEDIPIQTVAARLGDTRFQTVQRQAMAGHIRRVTGNQNLKRAVAQTRQDAEAIDELRARLVAPDTRPTADLAPVPPGPGEAIQRQGEGPPVSQVSMPKAGGVADLADAAHAAAGEPGDQRLQAPDTPAIKAEAPSDAPEAILRRLGSGQPLEGGLRSRMESAFGRDLSQVRTHTDGNAAGVAGSIDARAFTVGSDVGFGAGQYRPGTLVGDAIIAHELAHVVQQDAARPALTPKRKGATQSTALERDADRSALGAVASVWGRAKGAMAGFAQNAMPRLTSELRLQRCARGQQIEPPDYLGSHSLEAWNDIMSEVDRMGWIERLTVAQSAASPATGTPEETLAQGSHDVSAQAEALAALPDALRSRIAQRVNLLLALHGNDLTDEERAFWQSVLDNCQYGSREPIPMSGQGVE